MKRPRRSHMGRSRQRKKRKRRCRRWHRSRSRQLEKILHRSIKTAAHGVGLESKAKVKDMFVIGKGR